MSPPDLDLAAEANGAAARTTADGASSSVVTRVLVYFAMAAEAQPLVEELGLTLEDSLLPKGEPWVLHQGTLAGPQPLKLYVLSAGKDAVTGVDNVGTVAAAVAVYSAVHAVKPHAIVNAGTAGGFRAKGAAIGDVFIASSFANHDRRIPLPGFDEYGVGRVEGKGTKAAAALGLKTGVVSSGNSLDMTEDDRKFIVKNDATVKDMEGAAVAWVGRTLGVPVLGVKAVTDIVDGERATTEEFLENLAAAAAALKRTVPKVLEYVAGKPVIEL